MAFAIDDVVVIMPADAKHPALQDGSNKFGLILDTNVNGNSKFYRVAVGNIFGFVYVMEEADLAVYTGPISSKITASLPVKKKR